MGLRSRSRWHDTWVSKDTVNMWHKQAWRELLNMEACPFSFWPPAFINKRLLFALPSEFICDAGSLPSAAHAWPRSDGRRPSWQLLTAPAPDGKNRNWLHCKQSLVEKAQETDAKCSWQLIRGFPRVWSGWIKSGLKAAEMYIRWQFLNFKELQDLEVEFCAS